MIEFLTAILVAITGFYAYLTYRMAKSSEASVQASKQQFEAMFRPYIEVRPYVRDNTSILYLLIENTGRSAAQNVRLSIDRDFFQFARKEPAHNLRARPAFSEQIDSLGSGHRLNFALAQAFVIFGQGEGGGPDVTPSQFQITAAFEFAGKKFEEHHRIDLRPFIGTEGERNGVVEELNKIRLALEKK